MVKLVQQHLTVNYTAQIGAEVGSWLLVVVPAQGMPVTGMDGRTPGTD